jgi:tRNA(Arg) A34 adenosine deaminase TadA
LKLVLATSSAEEHIDAIEKSAGIDLSELFDEIAMGDDAHQSKPAPDIVTAAVRKLGMSPAQCAMVGDTPYDALAARDAGVVCLGVQCGGHDGQTLVKHGARAVWRDPADLFGNIERALYIASPGSAHLTQSAMEQLMSIALQHAAEGMKQGEAPIGCVIARGDGTPIDGAFNELNRTQNKTAHAEIVAFAKCAGKCDVDCRDLILVSTLEPCVMCTGAAMEAAVDTILYGLRAPADSGSKRVRPPQSPESQMPRIVGNILARQSRQLFEQFLKKNPPEQQARYVKQLLELNPAT